MMWTTPNNANDFTVLGKCKVGHKSDILCVESSSQFIASGGIDGLLSIWNLFSGTLKFAIELPPPQLVTEGVRDFNYQSQGSPKSESSASESSLQDEDLIGGDPKLDQLEQKSKGLVH